MDLLFDMMARTKNWVLKAAVQAQLPMVAYAEFEDTISSWVVMGVMEECEGSIRMKTSLAGATSRMTEGGVSLHPSGCAPFPRGRRATSAVAQPAAARCPGS